MKSNDDQLNKPDEQPALEGEVVLNLDTKRYKSGLTIEEWKKLRQKDPLTLTPRQVRQLEETNKKFVELTTQLSKQYDFTAIIKAAQSFPLEQAVKQSREAILAVARASDSLISPLQQLSAMQQNLALTSSVFSQALIDATSVFTVTRSLFASISENNVRLVKALQIDIPSLGAGLTHISATETVDVSVTKVSEQDGHIAIASDTTQTFKIDDFMLVSKAEFNLLLNEVQSNTTKLDEMKKLIGSGIHQGVTKISYADAEFKRQASRLFIKGFEVTIRSSSKQAQFCQVFFKSPKHFAKRWDVEDFIHEAFGELVSKDNPEIKWIKLLRNYIFELNRNILGSTQGQYDDFFVLLDSEVYINEKYLSNL